jgi:hypothetical protein
MLYIPNPQPPAMHSLTPGTTNVFVSDAPTMTLTHRFVGDDASTYASKAYVVQELDQLTGLTTDESGVLTFQAPVTLEAATVVFTDTGESWALCIGHLNPINTLSGIFQRLQNLGLIGGDLRFDPTDLNILRAGLWALKVSQSDGGETSAPAPASAPGSGPGAAMDSAPPSAPSPDSTPASDAEPDSGPPTRANGTTDNAGLANDGTLDADTTSLLLKAYGC